MTRSVLRFVCSLAVLGCAAGCTSHPGTPAGDAGDVDGGGDGAPTVTCENDPRVDTYVANLTKTSADGTLKVTLVSSDPAPPARETNTWIVKLADGKGAPLTTTAPNVDLFMPDHGHGTSVRPVITAHPDGTYEVTPVYLFMPGVWRVTFSLPGPDGGTAPSVPFFFCIAG